MPDINLNIDYNEEHQELFLNTEDGRGVRFGAVEPNEVHLYVAEFVKCLLTD